MKNGGLPSSNWSYPTQQRFGCGRVKELWRVCAERGIRRPLFVSDRGLLNLPRTGSVLAAAEEAGLQVETFADVQSNPTVENVEQGIGAYRESDRDGIVAYGGGSAMDAGKGVALMVGQSRPIRDFEDIGDNWKRADAEAIPPVLAVPTTSGTGSEVGRAAVITDPELGRKIIAFHPRLMPLVAILDPELAVDLPRHLTIATGFDALSHCFEAYSAGGYHPYADGIALEGLRLAARWLPVAAENGGNVEARGHMMAAAAMGATAFQKGLGAVHSLSHAVGAVHDTHHGLTNAVFLPYVAVYNRPAIEGRVGAMCQAAGLEAETFETLLSWILDLRKRLEVPHTAAELGVEESRLEDLAALAAVDPTAGSNPREADEEAMLGMLKVSMAGSLDPA